MSQRRNAARKSGCSEEKSKIKTHLVGGYDPALLTVFPQATDEQKKCFDLLKRAYVEARYNPGYKITKAQFEYLAQRVRKLQRLTKKICQARIESYLST